MVNFAKDRATSQDESEREIIKLIMNALYGKFLQNQQGHTNTLTYTDYDAWLQGTFRSNVVDAHVVTGGLCVELDEGAEVPDFQEDALEAAMGSEPFHAQSPGASEMGSVWTPCVRWAW